MTLTDAQRAVLVELSDGSWSNDRHSFSGRVSPVVLSRLQRAGYIRCDRDCDRLDERNWTATPDGLRALEYQQ